MSKTYKYYRIFMLILAAVMLVNSAVLMIYRQSGALLASKSNGSSAFVVGRLEFDLTSMPLGVPLTQTMSVNLLGSSRMDDDDYFYEVALPIDVLLKNTGNAAMRVNMRLDLDNIGDDGILYMMIDRDISYSGYNGFTNIPQEMRKQFILDQLSSTINPLTETHYDITASSTYNEFKAALTEYNRNKRSNVQLSNVEISPGSTAGLVVLFWADYNKLMENSNDGFASTSDPHYIAVNTTISVTASAVQKDYTAELPPSID